MFRMRNRDQSVQIGPGSGGNDIVPIDSLMDRRDPRSQGRKTKKKKRKSKRVRDQNQRLITIHGSVAVKWWGE